MSKLTDNFKRCTKCNGYGHTWIHSHGAFGEPESYAGDECNLCGGYGFTIKTKYVKKIKEKLGCPR